MRSLLPFRRVWDLSKEVQEALTGLVQAHPRGTKCCLYCEVPKKDRTLDKECGICFGDEICGCPWCKYYVRGLGRCRISLKMDQLRHGGLSWLFDFMDYEDESTSGRWVEVQLIKFFPRETFLRIINTFKRYGLKFSEETRSWGKEFKSNEDGYLFFEEIYKEVGTEVWPLWMQKEYEEYQKAWGPNGRKRKEYEDWLNSPSMRKAREEYERSKKETK